MGARPGIPHPMLAASNMVVPQGFPMGVPHHHFSHHASLAFSPSGSGSSAGLQPVEGMGKMCIPLTKDSSSPEKKADEMVGKFVEHEADPTKDEDCVICRNKLTSLSTYATDEDGENDAVTLKECRHCFHRLCLYAMYDSGHKDESLQCPTCKMIYGKKMGNCPDGEMEFHIIPSHLPSFDCSTIRIVYKIREGIQGPTHPNPGKPYTARNFPRICYLPNNEKGKKVLQLLVVAWKRRLIFTVGISSTTGESDTVTWCEIHHKTEFGSNQLGHGYPDPNYLDNVTAELASQGVTESDLNAET